MQMPQLLKKQSTAPVAIGRADLHEMAVAYAMEQFDRWGRCPPTWAIAAGGNIAWFVTDWDSGPEKVLHSQIMQTMMQELPAHAYAFVTEAYIANTAGKSKEEIARIDDLRNLPKNERDDALLVTTFDRAGGSNMTRFLVTIRQPVGPNFLGPRVDENIPLEGRMFNLLAAA